LSILLLDFQKHLTVFFSSIREYSYTPHLVFLLLFLPVAKLAYSDYSAFVLNDSLSTNPTADYLSVSEYVNNNTFSRDLVLGGSGLFPFIKSNNFSVITQSLASSGRAAIYWDVIGSERMVFNASYHNARFLVASPTVFEWLENNSLSDVSEEISGWPVVFNTTSFSVYKNPILDD